MDRRRRRAWVFGTVGAVAVLLLAVASALVVPILLHENQGSANQAPSAEDWPQRVTATGDDGRVRSLELVAVDAGGIVDSSALVPGDHLVVAGAGYDQGRGIYVAICRIPGDPTERPTPCLGGIPETDEDTAPIAGDIEWAPSNWISDDWAWKLFGARPFDDQESGTFTAYLLVPAAADENVDCRVDACAIYTRNDHTALSDRVQDLGIPVAFAP